MKTMNTKRIKNILVSCLGVITVGSALTSCNDFLDILPMNDVVLEKYWTQKSDVTSVLMGCYESLESSDCLIRMGLWGEVRSDNIYTGSSVPWELEQVIKENTLPTNSYCKWTAFYQTINRCNTICHYAPIVQQKDPNYTYSEMRSNVAEATTIRSLCYFYLIRTFRDVPFTRQPSIDDTQTFAVPATTFSDVLDSLIVDLEAVKDDAVKRYYADDNDLAYINTSRITRPAVYALLADLYLWKGEWDKCIAACDYVLDFKQQQFEEMKNREGNISDMQLFNGYPLIMERPTGSTTSGHAYNEIFGTGNSFESIFELYFRNNQSVTNSYISNYYIASNSGSIQNGRLAVNDEDGYFYGKMPENRSELFSLSDCRAYESLMALSSSSCALVKYARQNVQFNTMGTISASTLRLSSSIRSTNYSNWIVYRMTDVMLMKAEAEIEKGSNYYPEAFSLINAVNKRAINALTPSVSDTLKYTDYSNTLQEMRDLLLTERQREFLFEGKRWYDLVRMALREGSTRNLATIVVKKQKVNKDAIKIKLADFNFLFFPYSRDELKVNPYLTQNPAYNTGDDSEMEKN
mgnify:CR=1 FL=1